ncbi:MAG: DUF600 family protein [Erysipelotrichaceae bacterium]|nr:DUF600 family protein [Erysipelotrichaceae bacterium]
MLVENNERVNQFLEDLAFHLNNALPENWYHVVLGSFYYKVDEDEMDSYQVFYQNESDRQYINLLEEFWNGVNDNNRQNALDETSLLLQDLHNYCKEHSDDYTEMTFKLCVDGKFNVKFAYEEIKDFNTDFLENWKSVSLM